MKEEYSRKTSPKLLKDTQEAKKHIPHQGHLCRSTGAAQVTPSEFLLFLPFVSVWLLIELIQLSLKFFWWIESTFVFFLYI